VVLDLFASVLQDRRHRERLFTQKTLLGIHILSVVLQIHKRDKDICEGRRLEKVLALLVMGPKLIDMRAEICVSDLTIHK